MIDLITTKKTYLFRAAGAKLAELKGILEEFISRAGRWNYDQMRGCYLTALPLPFMRQMAGYPSQPGCFEVQRAKIKPPQELLNLIWPELDQWTGRFGKEDGQIDDLAAGKPSIDKKNQLTRCLRRALHSSPSTTRDYPPRFCYSTRYLPHEHYLDTSCVSTPFIPAFCSPDTGSGQRRATQHPYSNPAGSSGVS